MRPVPIPHSVPNSFSNPLSICWGILKKPIHIFNCFFLGFYVPDDLSHFAQLSTSSTSTLRSFSSTNHELCSDSSLTTLLPASRAINGSPLKPQTVRSSFRARACISVLIAVSDPIPGSCGPLWSPFSVSKYSITWTNADLPCTRGIRTQLPSAGSVYRQGFVLVLNNTRSKLQNVRILVQPDTDTLDGVVSSDLGQKFIHHSSKV